jgi:DNA repair exonuclease SbcCD ATPase subunit
VIRENKKLEAEIRVMKKQTSLQENQIQKVQSDPQVEEFTAKQEENVTAIKTKIKLYEAQLQDLKTQWDQQQKELQRAEREKRTEQHYLMELENGRKPQSKLFKKTVEEHLAAKSRLEVVERVKDQNDKQQKMFMSKTRKEQVQLEEEIKKLETQIKEKSEENKQNSEMIAKLRNMLATTKPPSAHELL